MMSNTRLKKLQTKLPKDTFLFITRLSDIAYFSNFDFLVPEEKEAYLVVTPSKAYLFYASFTPVKKLSQLHYIPEIYPSKISSHLKNICTTETLSTVLIDKDVTTVTEHELLTCLDLTVQAMPHDLISPFRMIKDTVEVEKIKTACQISLKAFRALKKQLHSGQTEIEVTLLLEKLMQHYGSQKPAFPTIVAFGEHGALPHHQPTTKKLTTNMPVLIDFGATYQKYKADMTRSFWYGDTPSAEFTKVEKIVQDAYQHALQAVAKGLNEPIMRIDEAARTHIEHTGYGSHFIHTTGHGVGLDIHEAPSINWKNEQLLQNHMVITIEPGIYLAGSFGYRYENTVLINKKDPKGYQELTLTATV